MAATILAWGAHAEFSWELAGGGGAAARDESALELDSEVVALSATYYFDPVDAGTGPQALASFLDPSTHISITAREDSQTLETIVVSAPISPPTSGGGIAVDPVSERNLADYAIEGQYLLPASKWYAGGRFARGEIDWPRSWSMQSQLTEISEHGLIAGKYFGKGATRLELSLARSSSERQQTLEYCAVYLGCFRGTTDYEAVTDELRIDVLHVRQLRSATYTLSGGVGELDRELRIATTINTAGPTRIPGLRDIISGSLMPFPVETTAAAKLDPVHTYSLGAEIFPIPTVGVRLHFARLDAEIADGDAVAIATSWFFRSNIGLELTLSRDDPGGGAPRTEAVALRFIGRL
jgi:hypothetical protein